MDSASFIGVVRRLATSGLAGLVVWSRAYRILHWRRQLSMSEQTSGKSKTVKAIRRLVIVLAILAVYPVALWWDIRKVEVFCEEMKPGVSVKVILELAKKYNVYPPSIREGKLGGRVKDQKNTCFFAVSAPMTIGEHACGVYHNQKVVLSAAKYP